MVPLQIMWGKIRPHSANANSLVAVVPISLAGGIIYYFGGAHPKVDLRFALLLAVGGVVGAYLGARFANRLPDRQLLMVVTAVLALLGAKELVTP